MNILIWSNLVVLEPILNFDQRLNKFNRLWRSFARFDYSISQFDHLIITMIYKHKYFTTFYQSNGQILDLYLVSWWAHVVVPTHLETLINPLTQSDHSKWLKYTIKARKWPKCPWTSKKITNVDSVGPLQILFIGRDPIPLLIHFFF